MTLRVAMAARIDWQTRPGGDTVQIEQTASHLRQIGVSVDLRVDPCASLTDVDLVHLTHLSRVHISWPHFRNARAAGKPIVISPIYFRPHGRPNGVAENARNFVRWLNPRGTATREELRRVLWHGFERARCEMARGALLLPNSLAELRQLMSEFGSDVRAKIIPNAVDAPRCRELAARNDIQRKKQVVCVGHFDPRKNQHALVEAMRDTDIPVLFIGQERGFLGGEMRRSRRRANSCMRFLGPLPHELVLQHMRESAVLACPSLYETPGLASLEAAAIGCNLALARCQPVEEYFKCQVNYFDPLDAADIRRAVLTALDSKPNPDLGDRIAREYDWSIAARLTREAYSAALGE